MKYRIVITLLFLVALFAAYALRQNDAPATAQPSNGQGIHLN